MTNHQELEQLVNASQIAGQSLHKFITFIQEQNPNLNRYEATHMAAIFLDEFPTMFLESALLMKFIKEDANQLISQRINN